jgi:hypothetical protein
MIKELRTTLWIIAAVLVPTGLLLITVPGSTVWAWTISDPLSAMVIGVGILGVGAYVLTALVRNNRDRDGIGGIVVCCCIMLIATMNHWDEFKQYHPVTALWLVACFVGSITLPIMMHRQQSVPVAVPAMPPQRPGPWKLWIIARGFLYGSIAILWFWNAGAVSTFWPWSIAAIDLQLFTMQPVLAGWTAVVTLRGERDWKHRQSLLVLSAAIGIAQILVLIIAHDGYAWKSGLGILIPLMFFEWILTPVLVLKGKTPLIAPAGSR